MSKNYINKTYNGHGLYRVYIDPYNPLDLPNNTIRLKFKNGYTPTMGDTQTLVDSTNNVWDIYKQSNVWNSLFRNINNLVEVLGANTSNVTSMFEMFGYCYSLSTVNLFNTSNVTNMNAMFLNCSSLTNVPLFDTSKVTDMTNMFASCSSLTNTPLFNTSSVKNMSQMFWNCTALTTVLLFNTTKVTNMNSMFRNCHNVQSGTLALYQQASSQSNPPGKHSGTFNSCGSNTQTGAAELAQIPSNWK